YFHVTGVQTCALPICSGSPDREDQLYRRRRPRRSHLHPLVRREHHPDLPHRPPGMDRVNLISIITPVAAGRHHYLPQAYESLLAQTLPAGWEWEWIVQEDGDTGVLSALPDDRRIRAGAGRAGRAAMARTLGLARARGVLTRTLDADDELTPGALYRDITTLIDNPDISWCVSPAVDLHPDGTETSGPCDPPAGPLAPGTAAEGYRNNQLPIVGGTVTAYTELVRLLGGWPALPASEDVALLLALEAVSRGWMVG